MVLPTDVYFAASLFNRLKAHTHRRQECKRASEVVTGRRRLEVIDDCFLRWREEWYIRRVERERVDPWREMRAAERLAKVFERIKVNVSERKRGRKIEEIARVIFGSRYSSDVFAAWK